MAGVSSALSNRKRQSLSGFLQGLPPWTLIVFGMFLAYHTYFWSTMNAHRDPIATNIRLKSEKEPELHHLEPIVVDQKNKSKMQDTIMNSIEITNSTKFLMFDVCGGFSKQRVSVINAGVLAHLLGRTLVLPTLQADVNVRENSVPFSMFYDVVKVFNNWTPWATIVDKIPDYFANRKITLISSYNKRFSKENIRITANSFADDPIVKFDCTSGSIAYSKFDEAIKVYWKLSLGLEFSELIMMGINEVKETIGTSFFTVFQGDFTEKFKQECTKDNCYMGILDAITRFKAKNLNKRGPIYFYTDFEKNYDMNLVRSHLNFTTLGEMAPISWRRVFNQPELISAINFGISLEADIFFANAGIHAASLSMLERKPRFKSSLRYDRSKLFGFSLLNAPSFNHEEKKVSWVFTLNNSTTYYDDMTKVAVLSAERFVDIPKYCIYGGAPNNLTRWMERHGVQVIYHELTWFPELLKLNITYNEFDKSSPNYASPGSLAATFLRTDVPMLKDLQDYEFVLYTDVDIMFVSRITTKSFSTWPRFFSCGPESKIRKKFPCNMGIMLMNMNGLRKTHDEFLSFVLKSGNLRFRNGPADQGAFNSFYKDRTDWMNPVYNWKPYWPVYNLTKIVHFHGPKLRDYEAFFDDKKVLNPLFTYLLEDCRPNSCKLYVDEYKSYLKAIHDDS